MKKYVCTVCGYIAEGTIPEQCPVCKAPASAFVEKTGNTYVTEHVVGIGKAEGVPQPCRWSARQLRGRVQRGRYVPGNGSRG